MNAYHLDNDIVIAGVQRIWHNNPSLGFTGKLRKVVKFYKEFGIKEAKERRMTEAQLRQQLIDAASQLQQDPNNEALQTSLSDVADRVHEFEERFAEGQRVRSRVKWKKVGDSCSKEFFKATREHSGASSITSLEDESGEVFTDQPSLERICHQYYSSLYTARPNSAAREAVERQALGGITDRLTPAMKARLDTPIEIAELDTALKSMAAGKAPGPDGVITEFYKKFWELIKADYLIMIQEAVRSNRMALGVNRGLISLLHKRRERCKLTNWRPITLLNVAYKLYAKALQLRLQPVLMEIISPDQSAFLPLRFILDNILLTHETMEWATHSDQPLIFLKLDFSKAYDMVDWPFLFQAMEKMGFPEGFIDMVKLLFYEASAFVKVNTSQSAAFQIERGVRQGCPLAPYLFLVVAEVLNSMVKLGVAEGRLKGITLPMEGRQQVLAQYADDTSLTLLGEEGPTREAIATLQTFCEGCGLILNWDKSCAYWKTRNGDPRPPWTEYLGVTWVDDRDDIRKLLGTPFGLSLTSHNVDEFLQERVSQSLRYWCTTKVNSTGRSIVVNKILISSIHFFISIWGGTKKGITRVRSSVESYLWFGTLNRTRTKVAWLQCCQPKAEGGLDLINPNDALTALMAKWVLKACEPGTSNLHALLRFRLSHFQPYSGGRWPSSLEYFIQQSFQAKKGSAVWNRIGVSWRSLVKEVTPVLPELPEEVLSESLWWSHFSPQIGGGFSKTRAARLHLAGLGRIRDLRTDNRFLTTEEAQEKFGLLPTEAGAWVAMTQNLSAYWGNLLTLRPPCPTENEWVGCFGNTHDLVPNRVFQARSNMNLRIDNPPQDWLVNSGFQLYSVLPNSNCLSPTFQPWHLQDGPGNHYSLHGIIHRVRVTSVATGPAKKPILLFYGRLDSIGWDPERFQWLDGDKATPFMNFSASLGRRLLRKRHDIPNPVERKWQGVLPLDFRLRWKTVWAKNRTPKEAGLLWLAWHRAVAVNVWRGRINRNLDQSCPVCPRRSDESVLHRFWECFSTQRAWQWGIHIMNTLITSRAAKGPWRMLTWKQGIFSEKIPRKFDKINGLWMAIRTVILWSLWMERNDAAFNNVKWTHIKLIQRIWLGLVDYGRVEWSRVQARGVKRPDKCPQMVRNFTNRWCRKGVIATMTDGNLRWLLSGPMEGFVFQVH
jgi:hypothetical protein